MTVTPSDSKTPRLTAAMRGQVEPLAAISAVFAVCIGMSLAAGVFIDTAPTDQRSVVEPTLDRTSATLLSGGAVDPVALETMADPAPDGYQATVTIHTLESEWQQGPTPPSTAMTATRSISVRVAPGVKRPGTLQVAVWRV